ncbi:MAG: hypothetical protein U9N10_06305 [Bacillota bacterium]|nr:hypothetical protein [Bacillota bacterium]
MLNSIHEFIKNGTKSIEKILKDFGEEENPNIGDLILNLDKPLQELQRNIISETIEDYDEAIKKVVLEKRNGL